MAGALPGESAPAEARYRRILLKVSGEALMGSQPFVKNPDQTVGQLIAEKVGKIGENIQVRRFVRFKLGEGIEKRQDDFAAEVMAQAAR